MKGGVIRFHLLTQMSATKEATMLQASQIAKGTPVRMAKVLRVSACFSSTQVCFQGYHHRQAMVMTVVMRVGLSMS